MAMRSSITTRQRRVQYRRLKFLKPAHLLQTKESKSKIGGNSGFLSVVFENSLVPMCVIRAMDMAIVDFNRSLLELMGFKASEIIGKRITQFNLFRELLDLLNQSDLGFSIFGEEIEFLTKKRERKSGLISISTITFENESYYVLQIQDITDSKQAMVKLKKQKDLLEKIANERTIELIKSSRRVSSILECIDSPFIIVDNDYTFVYVNEAAESLMGKTKDEVLGKRIQELFQQINPVSLDLYDKVLKQKVPENYEVYSMPLGRWIEINAYPSPEGMAVYFKDITERKVVELALRESEERFTKAFKYSPVMMGILEVDTLKIITVNDCALRILGFESSEIAGKSLEESSVLLGSIELIDEIIKSVFENGSIHGIEINYQTKNLEARTAIASIALIVIQNKDCFLISMTDITEKKALDNDLARLDRLNLIGEMAASIGHEVRNPMTTVRGFVQMLADKEDCKQYESYFELIIEELDRANEIIANFLSIAHDRAVNYMINDINSTIKSLAPMLCSDALRLDLNIDFDLQPIPALMFDEKEIRQLILNLVRNGLESMKPGATLYICTFIDEGELVLVVKDEGSGIPPELIDKIGTPFLTTKQDGTGLGLAVCYSIANKHNARIVINSDESGTEVQVRFLHTPIEETARELSDVYVN